MLRRNGPVIKSVAEGSLWWERFVKEVIGLEPGARYGWWERVVSWHLLQFDISPGVRIPDGGCILNHWSNVHFVGWISYALRLRFRKAQVPFAFLATELMWLLKFNLKAMVTPRYLADSTNSSVWPSLAPVKSRMIFYLSGDGLPRLSCKEGR